MFKHIVSTIFSKGIAALSNFVILLLSSNFLGKEGRGELALIILGVTVINLFQGIFSGSVVTYLVPRFRFIPLFISAFVWNIVLSFALAFSLVQLDLYPVEYTNELIVLSILQGGIMLFQSVLGGFERIFQLNYIEITKAVSTAVLLFLLFFVLEKADIISVVYCLMLAFALSFLVGAYFTIPFFGHKKGESLSYIEVNKELAIVGTQMQLNSISQMINYRFCFYLVEKQYGLSALGIFSNASALGELVWIVARSISGVFYTRIVNTDDDQQRVKLTLLLSKISLLLSAPLMLFMCLLPDQLYAWVFGKELIGIQEIIISMSVGIVCLSYFTLFNNYYAGVRKNHINLLVSLLGNVFTIVGGFLLISNWGSTGAGIATSLGYTAMLVALLIIFGNQHNLKGAWYLPSKSDFNSLVYILKKREIPNSTSKT